MAPSNQSESATHPNRIPRSEALQRLLNGDSGAIPPTRETAIEALVTVALRRRNGRRQSLSAADQQRLIDAGLWTAQTAERVDRYTRAFSGPFASAQNELNYRRTCASGTYQVEKAQSEVEKLEVELLGPLPPPPTESEINALLTEYAQFRATVEKPTKERSRAQIRAERLSSSAKEKSC
jgi:hypothetical protein